MIFLFYHYQPWVFATLLLVCLLKVWQLVSLVVGCVSAVVYSGCFLFYYLPHLGF